MKLSDQDKVIAIAYYFDESGAHIDTKVSDGELTCHIPNPHFLIEERLKELGWLRLDEHSLVKRFGFGITVNYSAFLGLHFLTGLTTVLEDSAIEKIRERRHLS